MTDRLNKVTIANNQESDKFRDRTMRNAGLRLEMDRNTKKITELKTLLANGKYDLAVAQLILRFLVNNSGVNSLDFEYLVTLINAVWRKRTGRGLNKVTDASGKVVCECASPSLLFVQFNDNDLNDAMIKDRLAACLMPLVKDRFVPPSELARQKLMEKLEEVTKTLFPKTLEN